MKKIAILGSIILSVTLLNATSNKEIKQEAKAAIMQMGKTLKGHIKSNMKKGGPSAAATFCSDSASTIEKEVNAKYAKGVSVKRVSLKNRNANNAALADEKIVLEQMQEDLNNGKLKKMMVQKIANNHYKVYKPVIIGKACMNCHGDVATMNKEVYKTISEKYPNDKATGYKLGELRGAFIAEIIK